MFTLLRDLQRLRREIGLPRARARLARHSSRRRRLVQRLRARADARRGPLPRPAAVRSRRRRVPPPRRRAARHRPGHDAHARPLWSPTPRCPSRVGWWRWATARSAPARFVEAPRRWARDDVLPSICVSPAVRLRPRPLRRRYSGSSTDSVGTHRRRTERRPAGSQPEVAAGAAASQVAGQLTPDPDGEKSDRGKIGERRVLEQNGSLWNRNGS